VRWQTRFVIISLGLLVSAVLTLGSTALASSGQQSPSLLLTSAGADSNHIMTEAQFIDQWLRPHKSLLTGDMIVAVGKWYAPSEYRRKFKAAYLAITACETSLGDPKLGGRLVPEAYNFGCVKSGSPNTPWGSLASGTIRVGNSRWWKWPDAWTGAAALGRLLKKGPGSKPGFYLKCIQEEDWRSFTSTYYGASVPGYENYHKRWVRFYNRFYKGLKDAGY